MFGRAIFETVEVKGCLRLNFEAEIELVSKELNHLASILHVYAGGLNFIK